MAADTARAAALERLRRFLDGLSGNWVVEYYVSRSGREWRVVWSRDGPAKDTAWELIRGGLEGCEKGGQIRVRPVGVRRQESESEIRWPPMPDLFSGRESSIGEEPQEVARSATGDEEKRPVQLAIKGLSFQLVTLKDPPRKANTDCARAILSLLYKEQRRFTGEELEAALEDCDCSYAWSFAVASSTATWLRTLGAVDNTRDDRGVGYGLTNWSVDPLGGEMP